MAKFNLNSSLENEFFKESFKYCKSCGYQTDLHAKFCIECGCKEFFDSLGKYKLNKELYCVKCLSHVNKNDKKCSYCGHDKFLNGNLAFYEMSRNYINELNKKSLKVENDVIDLRKDLSDVNSKINKTLNSIKKYEKEILTYSNFDDTDLINKINDLNQEINKYDALIADTKLTSEYMQELFIKNEKNKENEKQLNEELETNYLLLIDEVDDLEKQIDTINQEIYKYKFRIDLFNNSKSKNKRICQIDLSQEESSYEYSEIRKVKENLSFDEYPSDPRILFKLAKSLFDNKKLVNDEEYIRLNLVGFYQLMNNLSNKSGKINGADYYVLAELYKGQYNYSIRANLVFDKERIITLYGNALDLGIEEARSKIESLKKYGY